jgi:hypothetical protein
MDERLANRARTPRYTLTEAAGLVGRPVETVRRWSLGHDRVYDGKPRTDAPLIPADGDRDKKGRLVLSFLNLLELRMLSQYRHQAALQAIRRALAYAGKELGEDRPLLSVRFHVLGGDLFTRFAKTKDGEQLLLNASRKGQLTLEALIEGVAMTEDVDYEHEVAHRWWYRSRNVPVIVDTRVAGGHPITASTGVRLNAITSRAADGYTPEQIEVDTGATGEEINGVLTLAA